MNYRTIIQVAARWTNARNVRLSLSYRVAIRRNCLSLLNHRSTFSRSLVLLGVVMNRLGTIRSGRNHRLNPLHRQDIDEWHGWSYALSITAAITPSPPGTPSHTASNPVAS